MPEPTKATADQTSEGEGKNTDANAEGKGTDTSNQDAPKFTQADQNALAAKIRKEEKEKYEKQQAEEKRLAEEARAKEQGEFQKLAESRQKELDELKPKYESAESELNQIKPAFSALIEAELKALPDEVVESGPAKYDENKTLVNPLEVAAWLPKGKKLAERLDSTPAKPGNGGDPKVKDKPGDPKAEEKAKTAQASYTKNAF